MGLITPGLGRLNLSELQKLNALELKKHCRDMSRASSTVLRARFEFVLRAVGVNAGPNTAGQAVTFTIQASRTSVTPNAQACL